MPPQDRDDGGDVLATFAHDLRSPLSAILVWLRMLRTATADPAQRERAIDGIERSTREQIRLVEDMLDLGRMQAGTLVLDADTADVAGIVDRAVEAGRRLADERDVALDWTRPAVPIPAQVDAERLERLLADVLRHGVSRSDAGARIAVRIEALPGAVEIAVRDAGPPLAADAASPPRGAAGLLIARARHLVELHGGRIRAGTAGAGGGITLVLTLSVDGPPAGAPEGGLVGSPDVQGVRVLIVDDDPGVREGMRLLLVAHGAEVTVAGSAMEALDLLQREIPDVLVSDIVMPDADGYALLRRIRAPDTGDRGLVPAIAVTAHATATDRLHALAAGYQVHLAKPFEPAALVAAVAFLARVPAPRDAAR